MSFNMRDYVSDDHIESIGEIAKSQSAIIQALSLENSKLEAQLQQKENIIKEIREEVRIYEEQINDGTTNELDNYVFVQRLKKVLDKEVN